jgi:anthranilate phosphoribosyltransferase
VIEDILARVSAGESLSMEEMSEVIDLVMQGRCSDEEIAELLTALHAKGETVAEIAGAARAMRRHMTPIRTERRDLVDTCGTGGDGAGTFNISTAAALVAAAAGVPVAKHGNRGITSKSGSADVLAALGVSIEASVETVERCLDQLGICFCFAPQLHPSMRHVAAVRKRLGTPTIFNLLGPLCNPASAPYQLLGVGKPGLRGRLASALAMLGAQHAVVVCGEDGLDEVTLGGKTNVTEVIGSDLRELTWRPQDFGLAPADREPLLAATPQQSAAIISMVLAGRPGPARDIVLMNAAAAIWTAGAEPSLSTCSRRAAEAVDSGAARQLLARLIEASHS